MKTFGRKHYKLPVVLQQVDILLEKDLLGGSVVDSVYQVQTAGQKTSGEFDASDLNSATATFNYDWD